MRVRIVKHLPRTLEGIHLERFELDGVYEVSGPTLDLLRVSGYALEVPETASIRKRALKVFADARLTRANPPREALTDAKPEVIVQRTNCVSLRRPRRRPLLRL